MKKFKFYALAFAAIAFAGCSDDVIDGQGANTGVQGDAAPAYLTISFSANGNSSRAAGEPGDDTNNQGDQDGTWEDSGHHNDGTAAENVIKDALVVVAPAEGGTVGFAKLYSTGVDGDLSKPEEDAGDGGFNIVDKGTTTYYNPNPIKVAVGRYNVLVVVNPVDDLTETLQNNELTNLNDVNELYNKIVNQEYKKVDTEKGSAPDYEAPTYIDAVSELIPQTTGEGDDLTTVKGIMMANKSLNADALTQGYSVELTEANTPENPAPVTIDVERVLSKITFRETTMKDFDNITDLDPNIYPVNFVTGTADPITEDGAIENNGTYDVKTFCLAQDSYEPANEVYALYGEKEEFVGVYQKTDKEDVNNKTGKPIFEKLTAVSADTYKAAEEDEQKGYFVAVDKDSNDEFSLEEQENSIILQNREGTGKTHEYYVKLEGYALVNLSKSVFYVRHTTDASGMGQPFGTLTGSNFLYTPFWQKKNEINVEDAGAFTGLGDIFYNTLAAVSTESESLAIDDEGALSGNTLYKAISTLGEDQGTSNTQHGTVPTTGKFMAYCFENSTDVAHQVHGLSTGISFVATVWSDKACETPIDRMYLYSNHTFESLHAIQEAYGSHLSDEFEALLTKETVDGQGQVTKTEITQEDLNGLIEAGKEEITMYNGNTCYYYTTEIKHFDNGNPTELGNMEFAIMRNNIYSLAVSEISTIGAPFVDPTPNIENESSEAALKVTVQMTPWIVRYNDIEF